MTPDHYAYECFYNPISDNDEYIRIEGAKVSIIDGIVVVSWDDNEEEVYRFEIPGISSVDTAIGIITMLNKAFKFGIDVGEFRSRNKVISALGL